MSLIGFVALWVIQAQALKRKNKVWNKMGKISGSAVWILMIYF